MTLTDLEAKVAAGGVLISRRQLMRHCEAGTFDAKRLPAVNNLEQWFIAPASVARGIADIKTLQKQRARRDASRPDMAALAGPQTPSNVVSDAAGHDASRPDVSGPKNGTDTSNEPSDTVRHDTLRPTMSDPAAQKRSPTDPAADAEESETQSETARYIQQLETRIEEKNDVITILRGELAQRNDEFVRRNERERETNLLIRGLQNLVLRLQPGQPNKADVFDGDPLMKTAEGEGATA